MSRFNYTRPVPAVRANGSGGQYALGVTSGIIPATPLASAEVFQFRWNPANRALLAAIRKLEVSAAVSTTYFAAGVPVSLFLSKCTGWSAQGTGGTGVTIDATAKRNADMADSGLVAGDCRITGTDATGLGAGTKTIGGNALAHIVSGAPITSSLSGQIFPPGTELIRGAVGDGDYPIVLDPGAAAANAEGIIIRAIAPATGTWRISVNIEWDEIESFPYGTV